MSESLFPAADRREHDYDVTLIILRELVVHEAGCTLDELLSILQAHYQFRAKGDPCLHLASVDSFQVHRCVAALRDNKYVERDSIDKTRFCLTSEGVLALNPEQEEAPRGFLTKNFLNE